ncbi:unnamed protein product, partial [Rotaria sp. Silwood2]
MDLPFHSQDMQNLPSTGTMDDLKTYLNVELVALKKLAEAEKKSKMAEDALVLYQALRQELEEKPLLSSCTTGATSAEQPKLVPLLLDFVKLRQYLQDLRSNYDVSTIREKLKVIMASYIFIALQVELLESLERYTFRDHLSDRMSEVDICRHLRDSP